MPNKRQILTWLLVGLTALLAGCNTNQSTSGSSAGNTHPMAKGNTSQPAAGYGNGTATTTHANATDDLDWLYADEDEKAAQTPTINDPFEGVNRVMYGFNDIVYTKIISPPAKAYDRVMPEPAQTGISNFFTNAKFPVRWVSSIAQGKWERADLEARKFALNTTLGLGGIFKPSDKKPQLRDVPQEDMGQTLGHYGIGNGPYLVAPLLGPTTLRDFGGSMADRFLNPFTYLHDWEYRLIARATEFTNESPQLIKQYEAIKKGSVDTYTALRDGYIKYREAAVQE